MADTSKNKVKKGSPKTPPKKRKASVIKPSDRAEEIIQDRIIGVSVTAIAAKYGYDKSRVSHICTKNKDRIDSERAIKLADRQERINNAMDVDTENVVRLLGKSTRLLERLVDKVHALIDRADSEPELLDNETLFDGFTAATKAFDRVRASVLAQQKQAVGE